MFVDTAKVSLKAGKGGNGAVSFRHEIYIPKGGPDGGDGGRGGSIIFRADKDTNTLLDFRYNPILTAEDGKNGSGQRSAGLSGKDLIVEVPIGTTVWKLASEDSYSHGGVRYKKSDAAGPVGGSAETVGAAPATAGGRDRYPQVGDSYNESNEAKAFRVMLADLTTDGQTAIIARGGDGGFGNAHFKSSTRQTPQVAEVGEPGEEFIAELELKLLADVLVCSSQK